MAYVDQAGRTSQRAAIATSVAILQGAAILALVNGLAVHFIPIMEKPNPQGEQIVMPLQPLPDEIVPPDVSPKDHKAPTDQPTTDHAQRDAASQNLNKGAQEVTGFPQDEATDAVIPDPLPPRFIPRAASPSNRPQSWIGQEDYPAHELRMGHQGSVGFSLTIGTNGKVETCVVTSSSGYPGLDQATCQYITRRARFTPATDASGNPDTGAYSSRIRWVIPD